MPISEEQTIWYPGIYRGLEGDYATTLIEVKDDDLVRLVQERAAIDGEWTIENWIVGDNNEYLMRKMMAWVSDPKNIHQCAEANLVMNPTIDWICRELANASKWLFDPDS
jgi:hypothetical protein